MKNQTLIALMLLAACQEVPVPAEPQSRDDGKTFTFRVEASAGDTRSCYSETEVYAVTRAVVAVYSESGDRVHAASPETAVVLNEDHPYSYYVLTGDLAEETIPSHEDNLLSLVHRYAMDGTGGFVRYHDQWNAVPMAGRVLHSPPALLDTDGDGVISLSAERLFARIDLRIIPDNSLRNYHTVDIRSVRVRNFALSVAPFNAGLADRSQVLPYEADITQAADPQGYWTLYLPENLQGTILGGNTDPSGKTADALSAAGYNPDLCTYIETEVVYDSGFGIGGTARYRFYPGEDNTGNFDIRRNTPYRVTLVLTASGLELEGNWKVDTSDLSDNRLLTLEPLSESVALGGMAILRPCYRENGTDRSDDRFGTKPGYSAGYPEDVQQYLSVGSVGSVTRYTGINVMCDDCERIFPGYPENYPYAIRLAWFRNMLTDNGLGDFLCPECENALGNVQNAAFHNNDPLPPSEQHPTPYLAYSLPQGAASGDIITFQAATHDAKKWAEATVGVFRPGRTTLDTRALPKYPAQRGSLSVLGLPYGIERVRFRLTTGEGVVKITQEGRSCHVVATGLGNASVAIFDADSDEELESVSFSVTAPVLTAVQYRILLHPDGDAESVEYRYETPAGVPLYTDSNYDETVYARMLQPVFSTTGPYLACNAATGDVWIASVAGITTGTSVIGNVVIRAADCPQAGSPVVPVSCINPCEGMSGANSCITRIEDYTLFPNAEEQMVRITLEGHINARSFLLRATPLLSDSMDCESIQFSITSGNTHVLSITCGPHGAHAHGKIALAVGVENARSHEYLYTDIGYVEVFLHGLLGGKALLYPDRHDDGSGWVSCSTTLYPEFGGGPFDSFFDQIAGVRFIRDIFDRSDLYPVGDYTYYISDDNDWFGRNHQAAREEDRIYLTRYEVTPSGTGSFCLPSGEIFRIYPGLIDTHYRHFSSIEKLSESGNAMFLMNIDMTDIPGVICAGKDRNNNWQYGLENETDATGIPYRLITPINDWIVFDSV